MTEPKNIGVIGTGTWGTALARMLNNTGHHITCWSAIPDEIDQLSKNRVHPNLPGTVIPDELVFTKEIAEACTGKDILVFAVPSVYVRNTARSAAPFIAQDR